MPNPNEISRPPLPYNFKVFSHSSRPAAKERIKTFQPGQISPDPRASRRAPSQVPEELSAQAPASPLPSDPFDEAREGAKKIIAEALSEAEKLREKARAEGYGKGYDQGHEEGTKKAVAEQEIILKEALKFQMEDIRRAIESIEDQKNSMLEKHLAELAELAVTVAEKVIGVGLKSSSSVIEKMILSAAEQSKNRQWAKIYISKYDADLMMEGEAGVLSSLEHISDNVKITIMDSAEPGTCIVEFPDQIVDSSVPTQLQNIRDLFTMSREQ